MSRLDRTPFSASADPPPANDSQLDSTTRLPGDPPGEPAEASHEIHTIPMPPPSLIDRHTDGVHPPRKISNPLAPDKLKQFFRTLSSLSLAKRTGKQSVADEGAASSDASHVEVRRPVYNLDHFDAEYGYNGSKKTFKQKAIEKAKKQCLCSRSRLLGMVVGMFPFLTWMREYNWKFDWINDLTAGVTVGIMSIPQGMSYAGLVGVPAIYGLYTNLVPTIVYFFFGTARQAAIGTVAVVSLMMGTIRFKHIPDSTTHLSPACVAALGNVTNLTGEDDVDPAIFNNPDCFTSWQLANSTALLTGILLIIMGFMRLGFVSYYLSDYLVGGFTSGAAVHVFTSQIDYIFGLHLPRHSGAGTIVLTYVELFRHIHETNKATVIIACVCIIFLLIVKEALSPPFQKRFRVPLPGELMVVIIGTIASLFGHFKQQYDVDIVNKIPSGFPTPYAPRVDFMGRIFVDALVLAIVNYSLSVSLAKLYAKRNNYKIDPYQEFYAYGFINIAGGAFRSFPSGQSVARSIVYESSGAKSQFAGVIGTIFVIIVVLWLAPLLAVLPKACLGAIIVVACVEMLQQLKQLKPLFKGSKIDFSIYMVSFAAVVILDVTQGLAVSVLYAFFTVIYRTQCQKIRTMGRVADTDLYGEVDRYHKAEQLPGIKLFHFNAPLYYANVENFKPKLYKRCNVDPALIKAQQQQQQQGAASKSKTCSSSIAKALDGEKDAKEKQDGSAAPSPQHVIVDCSGFSYIDLMGVNALKQVYQELKDVGITVYYAACNASVRKTLELAGFYNSVPKTNLFVSVHDAMTEAAKKMRIQHSVNNFTGDTDSGLALPTVTEGQVQGQETVDIPEAEQQPVEEVGSTESNRHHESRRSSSPTLPISFTAGRKFGRADAKW